jgi:hypothetical protein
MGQKIQVGDYNLSVEQDWCIDKQIVYVLFMDTSTSKPQGWTGCLYEVPIDKIDHYTSRPWEDEWYIGQALAMMEKDGGFARVARPRLPGEVVHNATLQAKYDEGYRDGMNAALIA